MADITLVPIPTVQPGAISGNPSSPAALLASLAPGVLIKGFVLNRDAGGNPLIRTEYGDVLVRTGLFLKIGSEIIARLVGTGTELHARILTIDGQPPPTETSPHAAAPRAETTEDVIQPPPGNRPGSPLPTAPAPASPRASAPPIQAIVVQAASPEQETVTPVGSKLNVTVLRVNTDTATQASPAPTAKPAYAPLQENLSPALVPSRPVPVAATTMPTSLPATLIGTEKSGESVLHTPIGTLKLNVPLGFPKGTTLLLNIAPSAPALSASPTPLATPTATATPLSTLAFQWQAMEEILQTLDAADSPELHKLLAARMPWLTLTPQQEGISRPANVATFTAGMLLFLGALRGGDFRNWLGEAQTRKLEQMGKGMLLARAEQDFQQIRTLFLDTSQPWQTLIMPVAVDGALQHVRMYLKRKRKEDREKEKDSDVRFIVEVELSELGPLQIDGLVQREEATQVDLILRSHTPLSESMRREMLALFVAANELTGAKGSLQFAVEQIFSTQPMTEIGDRTTRLEV